MYMYMYIENAYHMKRFKQWWSTTLRKLPLTSPYWTQKIAWIVRSSVILLLPLFMAYDIGNPGSGLRQVHKCGRVELVNGIPTLLNGNIYTCINKQ